MPNGTVVGICIAAVRGEPMQSLEQVMAIAGEGLAGDRYSRGEGSFNKGKQGQRQVTLINAIFFPGTTFTHAETRRNIATMGVELMWLIGREFEIGEACMRGIKYSDPCARPSKLAGKEKLFSEAFHDRGGLVAEVIRGGLIRVGDFIIPPPKGY